MANKITTILDLDGKGWKSGLAEIKKSINDADGATGKMKAGWSSALDAFKSSPLAIAGASAAVGAFAAKAVNDASALEESVNAVNVAYGASADGVHRLGEVSATAFGMSQRSFNEFSVQFSAFAEDIANQSGRDVVDVLNEMTTRTADFASVNNLDMATAAQIMQSSLAGETEALRRYGGDVSAAAVEQFALEEGLIRTKGELTESIKVQARYGLLMRETAKTAGDFANTQDSLANQQKILSANIEDLSASLGKRLTPILSDAASTVNHLISAFEDLQRAAPGGKQGFFGGLMGAVTKSPLQTALELSEKAARELDEALGDSESRVTDSIVAWGEAREVAEGWTQAHVKAKEAVGLTADQIAASQTQMDRYVDSLVDAHEVVEAQAAADEKAAASAEFHTEQLERQREVTQQLADVEERRLDIVNQSLGGALRLSQSQRDARDSLWRYNEQVKAHNEAAPEFKLNQDQMKDLIEETALDQIAAAEAAARYREEQAEASGATLSAKDSQRILIEELFKVAETLDGPVRDAVVQAIADLNELARDRFFTVNGTIIMNQSGREGDIVALNGPRATGGPTYPGLHRVLERGPELLEQNGRTYLMSNGGGNVVPLSAGGMGAGLSIAIGSVVLPNVTQPGQFTTELAREIRAAGPGPLRRALGID